MKLILQAFFKVGAVRLLSMLLATYLTILLADSSSPEEFGIYSYALTAAAIAVFMATSGFPALLTRTVAADAAKLPRCESCFNTNDTTRLVYAAFAWTSLALLVVLVGVWITPVYRKLVSDVFGRMDMFLLAVLTVGLSLDAIRSGAMRGLAMPVRADIVVQMLVPLFIIISVHSIKDKNHDATDLLTIHATSVVLAVTIGLIMLRLALPALKSPFSLLPQIKYLKNSVAPFAVLSAVALVNVQISSLVLGGFGDLNGLAGIRIAEKFSQLVSLPLVLMNAFLAPMIVRARRADLNSLARRVATISFIACMPVALLTLLYGNQLLQLFFSQNYAELADIPMKILVVGHLVNVYFGPVGAILINTGHEKSALKGQLIGVAVTIFLSVLLSWKFGAIGAAIASATGAACWNLILYFHLLAATGISSRAKFTGWS